MTRTLRSFTEVTRAEVARAGTSAAIIERTATGTRFEYLPTYTGPAVAHTLAVVGEPVELPAGALPPFFSGLLPEGRRLSALRAGVKTSADDELSLLLAVGSDLVGDVTVTPSGEPVKPAEPLVNGGDISFSQLRSDSGVIDRVGLAGAQEKASGAMISLPTRLDGVACLIKLDPPEYPDVTRIEEYFLALATRLRLPVARAELMHDREGVPGLVVERFDRVMVDGSVVSLAVEDACQLAGRYPADKYRMSAEDIVDVIASACPARLVAARNCFQQFAFAWLTGNGDLHAKNLSVLRTREGEWTVAPIYDVPSTLPYQDRTMAVPLAGRVDGLTRKAFLTFAQSIGLRPRAAASALTQVLAATEPLLDDLRSGALPLNPTLTRDIVRQLSRRRRDLLPT